MDSVDESPRGKRCRGPYYNYQTEDGLRIPRQTLYNQRKRAKNSSNTGSEQVQQDLAATSAEPNVSTATEFQDLQTNQVDELEPILQGTDESLNAPEDEYFDYDSWTPGEFYWNAEDDYDEQLTDMTTGLTNENSDGKCGFIRFKCQKFFQRFEKIVMYQDKFVMIIS
jgi:hypothetical protein